jgi:hypothetical protein
MARSNKSRFAIAEETATVGLTIAQVKTAKFGQLKTFWQSLGKTVLVGTSTEVLRTQITAYLTEQALKGEAVEITEQQATEYLAVQQQEQSEPVITIDVPVVPVTEPIKPTPTPTKSKAPAKAPKKPPAKAPEITTTGTDNKGNVVHIVRPSAEQMEADNKAIAFKVPDIKAEKKAEKKVVEWTSHDEQALADLLSAPDREQRASHILFLVQRHGVATVATKTNLSTSKISREAMARRIYNSIPRVQELYASGLLSWAAIHDQLATKSLDKYEHSFFIAIAESVTKKRSERAESKAAKATKEPKPKEPKPKKLKKADVFALELTSYNPWEDEADETEVTQVERELVAELLAITPSVLL